jgi:transcriptional regulator with XRE-family HTH domain
VTVAAVTKPDPLLIGLGRAIRATREERQISQEELGWRSGVHRNYVGGVERAERRPSVATLARLALALDMRPSELLSRAERLAP